MINKLTSEETLAYLHELVSHSASAHEMNRVKAIDLQGLNLSSIRGCSVTWAMVDVSQSSYDRIAPYFMKNVEPLDYVLNPEFYSLSYLHELSRNGWNVWELGNQMFLICSHKNPLTCSTEP